MTTSLVTRPETRDPSMTLAVYAEVVSLAVAVYDATNLLPIPAELLRWHYERNIHPMVAAADIAQFTS